MFQYKEVNLEGTKVLLCDADGNLFPSEEPAFVASTIVTNRFMEGLGLKRQFTPTELRLATTGKNFRTTAVNLAVSSGISLAPELASRYPELEHEGETGRQLKENGKSGQSEKLLTASELESWVEEEKREVTAYLKTALSPNPQIIAALTGLGRRYTLTVVSSSASTRVTACLEATRLASFFPGHLRFSAEDSLAVPTSKPDPAIYLFASQQLKIHPAEGLAIEDSIPGAQAAISAGFQTIGNVLFVPEAERAARVEALKETGVVATIFSWEELVVFLTGKN